MTISCSATVPDKHNHKKLVDAISQLHIVPEIHAQTVIAEWQGDNRAGEQILQALTNLFELHNEHSVYYSTHK